MNKLRTVSLFRFSVSRQGLRVFTFTLAGLLLALCSMRLASAQGGSLTPPGAPAPTMKTLDQIEPRTPITSLPFTISTSGHYYLTGNLSVATGNGITVMADQVTLDLNGFTISSTASPASGFAVRSLGVVKNVTVRNGYVRGTTTVSGSTFTTGGFSDGINLSLIPTGNIRVEGVSVHGVAGNGIILASSVSTSEVERCAVSVCAGSGITAHSVRSSSVVSAGVDGIDANKVFDSSGETLGTGIDDHGIFALTVAENCQGTASTGSGVNAVVAALNCQGTSTSGVGLSARSASNCTGTSTTGPGLGARLALNCEGVSNSNIGMDADNATNCIGRSASGIGLDVTHAATNCYGESTSGSFGLFVTGTANSCRGKRDGGTAIAAGIAIGCTVSGTGIVTSANKFLGTP